MPESNYIHLHSHSCYSLLEASCGPQQLVEKAVSLGHTALALTDTNSCSGLYEFNDICIEKKIKPILGIEINVCEDMQSTEDDGPEKRIILLAKNKIGWKNICILSSESYITGFVSRPRIDYKILQKHSDGLILLTGGMDGHLSNLIMYRRLDVAEKLLKFCKDLFKDDMYIEIMFHPSPNSIAAESMEKQVYEQTIILAKKFDIKCVCTNDVKYCDNTRPQVDSQDVMYCIKQHKVIKDDTRKRLACSEYYMKSREELERIFPGVPGIFDVTLEICNKIEPNLIAKGMNLLPVYEPPEGKSPIDFLRSLVNEGLKNKDLADKENYRQRIDYELRVIEACGFVNYFLVLYDFVSWTRKNNIAMGPGRGSAAGSLALFCLDITKIDPIKYDLLFERFFSVDTKYVIDNISLGLSLPIKEDLDKKIQTKLYEICSSHSEFNEQRFISEGKRMKQLSCLNDFLKLFSAFINEKSQPGNLNECNSIIAFYAGMTSRRPESDFKPREELISARVSPPDVDLDFDYHRRDEVFGYLRKKYGETKTAQIGTSSYFMGKMVIKDVGKTLDIGDDWEENQKIKEEIKERRLRGEKTDDIKKPRETLEWVDQLADFSETGLSFVKAYKTNLDLRKAIPEDSKYYHICCQVDGLVRHHGVHAAGIVISKQDVKEVVPLRKAKGVICTQLDKDQVESIGLYKYDLLALMNVSVVDQTVKLIEQNRSEIVDIDSIEPVDPAIFEMLNKGLTEGVFQFEGRGATELVKLVKINEFKDLVACNAINRPGPLKAGVGQSYSNRKFGIEPIDYPHPSMKEVLEDTYGLIVYQEQIMNLSRVMASFSRSEADKLRKAIGKKKQDIMDSMRQKFIDGCENNGISKAIAVEVWKMIEYFGEYGFNKSHSLAYAMLAYQTAYLKRYYPLEYFCALLSSCAGDKDKIRKYQVEAVDLGVKLWPVNINKSKENYFIERNGLRLPFTIVDGVGESALKALLQQQPYASFEDFVKAVDTRAVTTAVIRNLATKTDLTEGAFKIFGLGPEDAVRKFELLKNDLKKRKISSERFVSDSLFSYSAIKKKD